MITTTSFYNTWSISLKIIIYKFSEIGLNESIKLRHITTVKKYNNNYKIITTPCTQNLV